MDSGHSTIRNNVSSKEKDKDTMQNGKEKLSNSEEKSAKTSRSTRYKDKFTTLRDKYEQVIMEQQNHRRDLETANIKMKKMQEEIDLLLEALMPTTPPAPSIVYINGRNTERDVPHSRSRGMEDDMEVVERGRANELDPRERPMYHESSRATRPQTNGRVNGNMTNGARHRSVEPNPESNSNYLPRESNGRIPIS
ncbi:hypothetical protein C8R42DRAFT_676668 [Lentinula raphanica]|nr:hypothetical protein C8R42DRAFT_676668 [Lentinula raphanica]